MDTPIKEIIVKFGIAVTYPVVRKQAEDRCTKQEQVKPVYLPIPVKRPVGENNEL